MKRSIVAAIVAVALAVVGSVALLLYVRGADARAAAGQKVVQVLVATKRIPAGTTGTAIRTGGFAERVSMPASSVPADALTAIDGDLATMAVNADLAPRQLLLRGSFARAAQLAGGLSLPAGTIAVTVEMRTTAQVAGFVTAGSKVAIFDTFTVAPGKPGPVPAGDGLSLGHDYNQATRLLLADIEVLAIGERNTAGAQTSTGTATASKSMTSTQSGDSPNRTVLVTVAATQAQAERLINATQTGSLYLALLGESSVVKPGTGVDNYSLFN